MFPNPTALPAATSTALSLPPNVTLSLLIMLSAIIKNPTWRSWSQVRNGSSKSPDCGKNKIYTANRQISTGKTDRFYVLYITIRKYTSGPTAK